LIPVGERSGLQTRIVTESVSSSVLLIVAGSFTARQSKTILARSVVRAEEKLTAFVELEAAIRAATQIP